MRVRIIGLGTNWWAAHSRDLNDPFCYRRNAAWFNSAGLMYGRRLRMCWAFAGQIRFNLTSSFDPDRPQRSIGKTFECSGPNLFDGRMHLLVRLPPTKTLPIAFLSRSTSVRMGTYRSQPAHGDRDGVQPISVSVRGARYESMVLMSATDWIETDLGRWILSADGRRIELETGTSERIA
jgi:hypothetical protein